MRSPWIGGAAAVGLLVALRAGGVTVSDQQPFDHETHAALFPTCTTCHAGAQAAGASLYPAPASCTTCHDGTIEELVEWAGRMGPPRTNLRFEHPAHAAELARQGAEPARCIDCHAAAGAAWMQVELAAVDQCLDCHQIESSHFAATESDCAVCHLPLSRAGRLTEADVADFPAPPSHDEPGFAGRGGHGLLGGEPLVAPAQGGVAVACATCHARDFCVQCHVDAPEQPAIQALEPDPRSLVHRASLTAPESHADPRFLATHGPRALTTPAECRTCHTQESCVECHLATPASARTMFPAGGGRGPGASIERRPPESHQGPSFRTAHGTAAATKPSACAACHARQDCLDCHRPAAGSGTPGYHPDGFLVRHPSAAYVRESSCGDCHNQTQFCADCHGQAGLVSERRAFGAGFHDAKQFFILGHGPAARQNLESCVTCHTERDCLICHSALGGRRFNPHGPDFDAERLRRRNPEMCSACHGFGVPGGS